LDEADVVGRQAYKENLLKPLELFLRFHDGEKKSLDEIKVERKNSIGRRKQ